MRAVALFAPAAVAAAICATTPLGLPAQATSPPAITFTDVTVASGVRFRYFNGGSGAHYYPEQFGGGAAFLDYNNDGWLDVFFVQGAPMPGYTGAHPAGNVLYRNNRDGTFTDVTEQAGLSDRRYGLGVAAADYDNDGDTDLFVTNLQGNALFRNDGHGRFTDVTVKARVSAPAMSTSAAFLDYNNDGWLDLFVARYTNYSFDDDVRCIDPTSVAHPVLFAERRSDPLPPDPNPRFAYCGPPAYEGTSSRLYRNNKDGTFTDVSGPSGIAKGVARGLGVAVADFNQDGQPDIFVASDMSPNLLFMNAGNGTFREQALTAGVALGMSGKAYAGMGVDAADYDNDGDIDLFITNYENEPSSLYRNNGNGTFADASLSSGIGRYSLPLMKWGGRFVDLDLDGHLDLLVLNGHVNDYLDKRDPKSGLAPGRVSHAREGYAQRAQIYRNNGAYGIFTDASWTAGAYFLEKHVGRGAAFGDFDNDGDWDVVAVNNNEPAALLRNDTARLGQWARLDLHGRGCNRDAIGARVTLKSGGVTQTRYVTSGGSFLSDHDRRLLFGLPGAAGDVTAEIRWPCGSTERITVKPGTSVRVDEMNCLLTKKAAN